MKSTDVPRSKFECHIRERKGPRWVTSRVDPNIQTTEACNAAGGITSWTYNNEEKALVDKLIVAENAEEKRIMRRNMIIALSLLGGLILLAGASIFVIPFIVKRRRLNR